MKRFFTVLFLLITLTTGYTQSIFWKASDAKPVDKLTRKLSKPNAYKTLELDFEALRRTLDLTGMRGSTTSRNAQVVYFPNADGKMEKFSVVEAPTLHPDLTQKYPGIKSFAGQGIDNPTSTIRFSISNQRGFHGLLMTAKGMAYIDPLSSGKSTYAIYKRKDLSRDEKDFQCMMDENIGKAGKSNNASTLKTNDQKLRKYRLALSCNAEYGNIFAGPGTDAEKKANILAQMNITMTRVNGIYERDLAITMEIIANNDELIYFGDTGADPWNGEWNAKTQQVIDATIGDANYDIGHNFNTSGGGNAGCIGCVCTSGEKGSGYTGSSDPTGDPFDVDFVAHEMGHQFGGYHTMNNCKRSGSDFTEVEPSSGSTIMGYAGVCAPNVQNNSDAYFGYVNIRDISANIQSGISSGCPTIIDLSNNPPVADAGNDYTIPKSTPFVLKGAGNDPDGNGTLTYCWEQNDPEEAPGEGSPESTWTEGPLFRSLEGTSSPDRYMPAISTVLAGDVASTWEVLPSVGRTMNFSLTVRDNNAGGGQTSDDTMVVTVDGNSGPFKITSPNEVLIWEVGDTETVTWDVANTDKAPVNCSNVNILLSTDGGSTYPITLLSNVQNNGSAEITVPNNLSEICRIKIEPVNNIFYDVSDNNIKIITSCTVAVPTGITTVGADETEVILEWNDISGPIFDIQYRVQGSSTWINTSSTVNQKKIQDLEPATTYEVQIRTRCNDGTSEYSAITTFSTAKAEYCLSYGESVEDESIGRVQIESIDNLSEAATGYTDFTALTTNLTVEAEHTITITPQWATVSYNEGYAVWIDYNQNGLFTDTDELVWSKAPSKDTPVSGSFTVPANALLGTTRMRVAMKFNGIPDPCEVFQYGEVEDYTVKIVPVSLKEVIIASNNTKSEFAKVGDEATLQFRASKTIQTPTVTIQGNSVTASLSAGVWIAKHTFTEADAEGKVVFSINYADLNDEEGEQVTATTDGSTVFFDKTPPTLTSTSISSDNSDKAIATVDDKVTLTFIASEKLDDPTVTISGDAVVASLVESEWRATRTMSKGDTPGLVAFSISYRDLAGNEAIVTSTTDGSSVEFVEEITGLIDLAAKQVKAYPNPASNEIIIQTEGIYGAAEIRVIDFTGRKVLSKTVEVSKGSKQVINVASLANGTYALQVAGDNMLNTTLIVISK